MEVKGGSSHGSEHVDQRHYRAAPGGRRAAPLAGAAHRLYEVNPHIFEDEREALVALGAEPPAIMPTPPVATLSLVAA